MAITEQTIPEKKYVRATKDIEIAAGKKIAVFVDGVEDTDLSYTVPTGKTLKAMVMFSGEVA